MNEINQLTTMFTGSMQNTFSGVQEWFRLSDKEAYILRQIDQNELELAIDVQVTCPCKVLNKQSLYINQQEYQLTLQGEYFSHAAYLAWIVADINKQLQGFALQYDQDVVLHQRIARLYSTSSVNNTVILTKNVELAQILGMEVNKEYVIPVQGYVQFTRKMWIKKHRYLQVFCQQLKTPTTVDKGIEQYLIIRRPWEFDGGDVAYLSNNYQISISTEQACYGMAFIFTSEDMYQYIDWENEQYKVFMTFTPSRKQTEYRKLQRMVKGEVRRYSDTYKQIYDLKTEKEQIVKQWQQQQNKLQVDQRYVEAVKKKLLQAKPKDVSRIIEKEAKKIEKLKEPELLFKFVMADEETEKKQDSGQELSEIGSEGHDAAIQRLESRPEYKEAQELLDSGKLGTGDTVDQFEVKWGVNPYVLLGMKNDLQIAQQNIQEVIQRQNQQFAQQLESNVVNIDNMIGQLEQGRNEFQGQLYDQYPDQDPDK